jgi:hypothetical protein
VAYQSRQNKPQQEKNGVQELASLGIERLQQRGQVSNHELQETKPRREDEETVQYVQRPHAQKISGTETQILTDNPQPEEEIIHFIHIPRTPQTVDVLTKYQADVGRPAQTEGLEDGRARAKQQIQEQSYQTEQDSLPQQTPSYQQSDKSVVQQPSTFHPIVVAELPTTAAPSPALRRRRLRPGHNRAVYHAPSASDQTRNEEALAQYLVSYDSFPEATSFGTRNSRLKNRRPTSDEKS